LERVFNGDDKGAHRDALLMGTSLVLEVTGVIDNLRDGVALAADAIDSGKTSEFLAGFSDHFSA
jgi:anthranilate phosphoribosyltransferase